MTAARSPWQNPYAERLIGSLRRDCLDHVIVLGEVHLRRILGEYFQYYNGTGGPPPDGGGDGPLPPVTGRRCPRTSERSGAGVERGCRAPRGWRAPPPVRASGGLTCQARPPARAGHRDGVSGKDRFHGWRAAGADVFSAGTGEGSECRRDRQATHPGAIVPWHVGVVEHHPTRAERRPRGKLANRDVEGHSPSWSVSLRAESAGAPAVPHGRPPDQAAEYFRRWISGHRVLTTSSAHSYESSPRRALLTSMPPMIISTMRS